jgi:AbiV family abortive infection protein
MNDISFLNDSRKKVIENAHELLNDALLLYRNFRFPRATLCAMTCIEECGKLVMLRRFCISKNPKELQESNMSEFNNFQRNHTEKTLSLSFETFFINAGTDRRQGEYNNKTLRTSGIVLLAKYGKWMHWRNSCSYTDINIRRTVSKIPNIEITKETAYYFICMAYEAIAECAEAGYGPDFEMKDRHDDAILAIKIRGA